MPVTVAERLAANERWGREIDADARALGHAWRRAAEGQRRAEREALEGLDPGAVLPTPEEARGGAPALLTEVERWAVLWQYRERLDLDEFTDALLRAAGAADARNLDLIGRGWPELAEALVRWRTEPGFATRVRARLDA